MATTNAFFEWFFYGLNGLGGWMVFLLLALAAVVWSLYDSGTRRLQALGWKMGIILSSMLILPAILYRFTTDPLNPFTSPLAAYAEPIFYLGVLGGLLPIVLAVGYFVTFQGMLGCPRSLHPAYEAILGKCPGCAHDEIVHNPPPVVIEHGGRGKRQHEAQDGGQVQYETKRKVPAWLVGSGKTYQLCERVTTIGRASSNDIYLTGDETVSRQQAKIVQDGAHFKLQHIAETGVTQVNGRKVNGSILLDADDEIKFGDRTVLRFKL